VTNNKTYGEGEKAVRKGYALLLSCNPLSWESLQPPEKGAASRDQQKLSKEGLIFG